MPQKILIVLNEQDQVIEQIPCNGTNSSQQRQLEKETKKRYAEKVKIRCVYTGVSEELFERTKALLEDSFKAYPEMGEVFVKDLLGGKYLGYNIKKKYK